MKEVNFKETEIGKIPVDWEVKTLGEIAEIDCENLSSSTSTNYSFNYISLEDVDCGKLTKYQHLKFDEAPSRARRVLRYDDLLFSTVRPNLKSHFHFKDKSENFICSTGFAVLRTDSNSNFIYQNFFSNHLNVQVENLISGSNYPAISSKNFKDLVIPLPPLSEQEKIAEVLSDTDLWIESTEALLAKKRQIKKGAMQKLLSPKEDWEVAELKDVAWFQEGPGLRNWQFTDSGMKVINVTNLENGYLNLSRTKRYISLQEFDRMYKHFEIQENDIVVASSGNSYGKIAVVREKDLPLVMNTSVIRFKPLEKIDCDFLLVFLKSVSFKDQIDLLITGGAQPNFGPAHLNKILVDLPPKNEQKIIADVILSMDLEIESLENRLQKARQLKQGMMQDLLTGKVRLV